MSNTTFDYTTTSSTMQSCRNSSKPDLGMYFLESGFIVEIIIVTFSLYLTIAFVMHGIRCKMLVSRSKKDMHRGLVYKFALVTVLIPFLRYGATMSYILSGRFCLGELCEISADVGYVMLMCSITSTYSFLWIRQRVFYGHPSLCDRYGRCLVYFSKYVLIPIVLEGVIAVSVAVYPREYTALNWECHPIVHKSDPNALIYAALMVLTQSCLLGLFLHPVVSHMKIQRRVSTNGCSGTDATYSRDSSFSDATYSKYTSHNNARPSAEKELSSIDEHADSTCYPQNENTKEGELSEICETDALSEVQSTIPASPEKLDMSRKPRSKSAPDLYRTAVTNNRNMVLTRSTTVGINSTPNIASSTRKKSRMWNTLIDKRDALKKTVRKTRSTVRSRGKVMDLIKRTIYMCLICILSDFSASVINTAGWDAIAQGMQFVIYDISLLINVITVIASFENFGKMLYRPLRCRTTKKQATRKRSSHGTIA